MIMTRSQRATLPNRSFIIETGVIPTGLQFLQDTYSFKVTKIDKIAGNPVFPAKAVNEDVARGDFEPIMRVAGLFQQCDIRNANGRVYPRPVLAGAIKNIKEDISCRSVYGEFDHPADAKIHMDRICHLVTKTWMEGTKIYGEAEILDNQPYGRCLRGLFERKCQVGISSRGVGDMELREGKGSESYYEVLDGYTFITWDCVADPSVRNAILSPVMESLNRQLKPIKEANKRGEFFTKTDYEAALLDSINKFFSISDMGQRPARTRRVSTFRS